MYQFTDAENLDIESVLTRKEISIMPLTTQRVDTAIYGKLKVLNQC